MLDVRGYARTGTAYREKHAETKGEESTNGPLTWASASSRFGSKKEARRMPATNFIVNSRFRPFAVRDGRPLTGQQQYSGSAAARLVTLGR
jgi:hypothetical protein